MLLLTGSAQAQVKLGFINSDQIIQAMPEFKDVEGRLQVMQNAYQDTLNAMQNEWKDMVDKYQKQQALMTSDAKAKEEANINARREQILQYQQDRLGQQGMLAQAQARLIQPIRDKIRAAIEKVAKDEKLTAVMETGTTLYFDAKMDITFKVLDYIKRGNQ
jgi:outer membrane protein